MIEQLERAGRFTLPGTTMTVNRMGYGAMQLAGPEVFGPPRDVNTAIAVLREALASGVNHIDTSDFYGPHVTNQIIKQALHPYPDGLVIVTKLGARRGTDKSWIPALSPEELTSGVHDNLRNLGLERLDIVNLRVGGVHGPSDGLIEEPLTALAQLKSQGLIRYVGLSNVTATQFREAQKITKDEIYYAGQIHRPGQRHQSKESVFKSPRILPRAALPFSWSRVTSSMDRRPRRASEWMPAPFSLTSQIRLPSRTRQSASGTR